MNPIVKVTLSHLGYKAFKQEDIDETEVDITNYVDLSNGITIAQSRDGLTGLIPEVSFPLIFAKNAYQLLKELFFRYGIYSYARVNVYLRDYVDCMKYNTKESFEIDFTNDFDIDEVARTVSATLKNITIRDFINSNGRTKYDFPVSDLKESNVWDYERLPLEHVRKFIPVMENAQIKYITGPTGLNNISTIFLNQVSSNTNAPQKIVTFKDQSEFLNIQLSETKDENLYFAKVLEGVTDGVEFNININLTFDIKTNNGDLPDENIVKTYIRIINRTKRNSSGVSEIREIDKLYISYSNPQISKTIIIEDDKKPKEGDRIIFYIGTESSSSTEQYLNVSIIQNENTDFTFLFIAQNPEKITLDVIKPERLLEGLLSKITGGRSFDYSIEWITEPENSHFMLCVAESIRNIPNANIHTSFDDFNVWMRILGYSPYFLNGNKLIYRHLDKMFDKSSDVAVFNRNECGNFKVHADPEFAYSSIRIGYNVPDYSVDSGRFEPNGLFSYSTDVLNDAERVYDLISPYRADPIGIELLSWERPDQGKESTDSKSDNDVFAVVLKDMGDRYIPNTDLLMLVNNGKMKLYNAYLNPYFLAKYNAARFSIGTSTLYFTATDLNRDAEFSDSSLQIYGDQKIENKLFYPVIFEIDCLYKDELFLTEKRDGAIGFWFMGQYYRGLIKDSTRILTKQSVCTLSLYAIRD